MKRSKFSEEQVAYALRQVEAGSPVGDVCRQLGSGVTVILERRQVERRHAQSPVVDERRHDERRLRQGNSFALGYTVIRFKRKLPPGQGVDRVDL